MKHLHGTAMEIEEVLAVIHSIFKKKTKQKAVIHSHFLRGPERLPASPIVVSPA